LDAELVAIEVWEVRHGKAWRAFAGSALVGTSEHQSLCVKSVQFFSRIKPQAMHRAVADDGGLFVIGAEHDEERISEKRQQRPSGCCLELSGS
jgi:hypothetical protein